MLGKKLISQSLIYGLASLLINGSNFFLIPFYTHYLSTSEYGIISSFTIFSTFLTSFLVFGLNGAITRFYFEYNQSDFKKFLFTMFGLQIFISLVICLTVVVFNGMFLDQLFSQVRYDPYLKLGLWIGFFGAFSAIPLALMQAQSKALLYRIFTTVSFVLLTGLMIVFIVYRKDGSLGGAHAYLFANMVMAVMYSGYIIRHAKFEWKLGYAKTALAFSLPLLIYAVFGTLTEMSSKYFIERFISLSELGIFNVAQQFSAIMILMVNAINMAWTPIFYSLAKEDESSKLFSDFGVFLIFSLTFAGLGLSLFSEELIAMLMSQAYQEAAGYMPVLVLAYIVGNGYWILIINPLSFSKKTIYLPVLTIVSGATSIGLNLVFVPWVGVMGAAVATCITYFVLIIASYFPFRKFSAVRYNFGSMNSIVAIAICLYLLSKVYGFESLEVKIMLKLGTLAAFYLVLKYLKIYSFRDMKGFIQSQFKPTF